MPTYEMPDLDYAYDALEPRYSAELLELHHSKHHQGYVDGANKTLARLAEARSSKAFGDLPKLAKDLAFNVSGHHLHSLFWKNMSPGDGGPDASLNDALETTFGSLDDFRDQFKAAGGSIQGSGWAALAYEPTARRLIVEQIYDHQGSHVQGATPILVMDMWEHAFYLQYRNEKKRWIDAFWELINWQDVSSRYAEVRG
ncbi:MAG: superoxide dismutase [Pseudomonadota bacterium]